MPPRGARKISFRSREWTRDDAPDPISIGVLAGDFADIVEAIDPDHFLMGRDLENRIR